MAIKKFKFYKLVRDNIVPNMLAIGQKPVYRVLESDEYRAELLKKLSEEASELISAPEQDLLGEIADLQEIVDALVTLAGISKTDLDRVQSKKNTKNGSFGKRYYVDYVEADTESDWGKYFLEHPEKYPQL